MKRLGKTQLHRLIEALPSDEWTDEARTFARDYLATRPYTLRTRDVAAEAGFRRGVNGYLDADEFFDACRPSEVLAAYDRLRQGDLEYLFGTPVTLETTDKNLRAIRRTIVDESDGSVEAFRAKSGLNVGQVEELLKEIDRALGGRRPREEADE